MNTVPFSRIVFEMGRDWAIFEYREYMRDCAKRGVRAKSFIDFIYFVLFKMPEPQEKCALPIDFDKQKE